MPEIEIAFFRGVVIEKTSMYYSQLNTTKMLRQLIILLGIVMLSIIVTACNDEDEEIPNTPLGTMSMKVDGEVMPQSTTLLPRAKFMKSVNELYIEGWFESPGVTPVENTMVSIGLRNAGTTGEFEISGNVTLTSYEHYVQYAIGSGAETYYSWLGSDPIAGTVKITKLDLTNKLYILGQITRWCF
jgi:hypothetical protein